MGWGRACSQSRGMTSMNRRRELVGSRLAPNEPVPQIAAHQAGVFTTRQALDEGWTRDRIRKRLQAGFWIPVIGRGIVSAGREISAIQRAWATYLTVVRHTTLWAAAISESEWTTSVVSHMTAGAVYGFPLDADRGHIIAAAHRAPSGIHVHRDRLLNSEVVLVGGLRLTTKRRTALDCLAFLDWDAAVNLWAWLMTRQILTGEHLGAAARDRLGRRGTPNLVRLLRLANSDAASIAELKFHQLLRAAGLTDWQANVQVRDADGVFAVVDVLFSAVRLVIEIDGFAAHQDRERFMDDRRRDRRLEAAGYRVLHVTWDDIRDCPDKVLADIRAVLLQLSVS